MWPHFLLTESSKVEARATYYETIKVYGLITNKDTIFLIKVNSVKNLIINKTYQQVVHIIKTGTLGVNKLVETDQKYLVFF